MLDRLRNETGIFSRRGPEGPFTDMPAGQNAGVFDGSGDARVKIQIRQGNRSQPNLLRNQKRETVLDCISNIFVARRPDPNAPTPR
jgi:hypothetical protein